MARYYITQIQDGEMKLFIYNFYILFPAKHNHNTYWQNLAAIVKFAKKYFYILNAKQESVIHIDHKPLDKFINIKYLKKIFVYWANKLWLLNIYIHYIMKKKNLILDKLSQIIFNNPNYLPNWLIQKLAKEVKLYYNNNNWFWKLGKTRYKNILMQLIIKNQAIQI